MVVDSSAVIAILQKEEGWEALREAIGFRVANAESHVPPQEGSRSAYTGRER